MSFPNYKELLIRAVPGLHEKVVEIINNLNFKNPKVLDLGAGQGSLSLRLNDLGFNVTAVDFNIDDFKVANTVDFIQVDFNNSQEVEIFLENNSKKFDIIIGIEVIEHIHNPWKYVEMMSILLKTGGAVIVSTPNISSWHSRLRFLYDGMYDEFNNNSQEGHINPTSMWELNLILKNFKFKDIEFFGAGKIYQQPSLIQRLLSLVSKLFRPFLNGILDYYCIIGVGKK